MKKTLGNFLLQTIPVMIGVYLGFVISNWSKNNQTKRQADILATNLISEIETNKAHLAQVFDYHVILRDSSRYYANPNNPISKPGFFQGSRVMKLSFSAYNTGIQTGIINELPLDLIQQINHLYTLQQDYNDYGDMMMASLINKDFSPREEDVRKIAQFLAVTMTDIVIKERELIDNYQRMADRLKNR
jgi:hypothetical protein